MHRRRSPTDNLLNLALDAGIPTVAALKRGDTHHIDGGAARGRCLRQATSTSWRNTMTATNTSVRAMSKDTPPIRIGRTTRRTGASTGSVRR